MVTKFLIAILATVLFLGCANTNMPKTTINGVPIGGGSAYCVALSALVGALGGGLMGTFLSNNQAQSNVAANNLAWGTIGTAGGAAIGGATGHTLCSPTTSATKASEPTSGI